jgi:hypothetical protein
MYDRMKEFRVRMSAIEHQKFKDQQSDKFPHCRGLFDDCPSEEEFNQALKDKVILRKCKICPNYIDK